MYARTTLAPSIITIDVVIFIQKIRKVCASRTKRFQILEDHSDSAPRDSCFDYIIAQSRIYNLFITNNQANTVQHASLISIPDFMTNKTWRPIRMLAA